MFLFNAVTTPRTVTGRCNKGAPRPSSEGGVTTPRTVTGRCNLDEATTKTKFGGYDTANGNGQM